MNDLPDLTIQIIGDKRAIKDFVAFLENAGVRWTNATGYYPPYRFRDRIAYTVDYVSLPPLDPRPGPYDAVLGGRS
ncbi:hypothetical protein C7B69_12270 [filamentous cyanobacterium Phorm 46]|nr:hypothetical protein C7B69_12270 [filamentous cyanobacterium Phorm 46]